MKYLIITVGTELAKAYEYDDKKVCAEDFLAMPKDQFEHVYMCEVMMESHAEVTEETAK